MHPEYFETCFRIDAQADTTPWPEEFGIVSAYATTGQTWLDEANLAADERLSEELRRRGVWLRRVVGFSPATSHAEPSWAAELPFDDVCDFGLRFKQDAVYVVHGDSLLVSFCDARRGLVPVGPFRDRLRFGAASPLD